MDEELTKLAADCGLIQRMELIRHLVLPSVRLVATAEEKALPVGASRIGGCPDLPADRPWPRLENAETHIPKWNRDQPAGPLPFLAQINFHEIAPQDRLDRLPATGTLFFFCDTHTGAWQINYDPGEPTRLQRTDFPNDLPEKQRYQEHRVQPHRELTLPCYEFHGSIGGGGIDEPEFFDVLDPILSQTRLTEAERPAYRALIKRLAASSKGGPECHRMLGWPDYVQNPMKLQMQVDLRGEVFDTETYETYIQLQHPRTLALRAEAQNTDWTLLLQIASIYSTPNMGWGDGGVHYLWIKRADLERCNFSDVRWELQTG